MNLKWFLWALMLAVISACAPAVNSLDEAARAGAVVARSSGDEMSQLARAVVGTYGADVVSNAKLLAGKTALQNSDDYARMISSSLDDLLRNQPVDDLAQQFAANSDDVLRRSPTAIDYVPPQAVYSMPRSQWPRLQQGIADEIGSGLSLSAEDAELFLQTTCWVTDYVKLYGEYPSTEYSLFYIQMQAILDQMEPEQRDWAEFIGQLERLIHKWADERGETNLAEASQLLFDGMCLIN